MFIGITRYIFTNHLIYASNRTVLEIWFYLSINSIYIYIYICFSFVSLNCYCVQETALVATYPQVFKCTQNIACNYLSRKLRELSTKCSGMKHVSLFSITPWPEFASELYRPCDHPLSAKLVPTFSHRGCRVVSATDLYGRIFDFLARSRYFFFQVAPQLYSRGWVDPVPDPLLTRKSSSAGNRTRTCESVTHFRNIFLPTKIYRDACSNSFMSSCTVLLKLSDLNCNWSG
jgi:hypothetical protein